MRSVSALPYLRKVCTSYLLGMQVLRVLVLNNSNAQEVCK